MAGCWSERPSRCDAILYVPAGIGRADLALRNAPAGVVNYEDSCNDCKQTHDEAFHKPSGDLGQPALRGLTPTQQDVELTVKRRVALELEIYKLTRVL